MSLLVDSARWAHRGRLWAHLVSDADLDELHTFAARLGLPERAFHRDHYDLPSELRGRALELGALESTSKNLVRALRAAGLRAPRAGPGRP